jgi:putative transposase
MLTAHRIALDPNNVQATYLARAAGVARFAYNWGLAEWQRQYVARQADPALPAPSQFSLRSQLNAIKRERYPWMLEVTKCAPQMAIIQLGEAFRNFFAHRARYPRFRRKGVDDRFTLSNDLFRVGGATGNERGGGEDEGQCFHGYLLWWCEAATIATCSKTKNRGLVRICYGCAYQ